MRKNLMHCFIAYTIGFESFFEYMGLVNGSAHANAILGAANGLYVCSDLFFFCLDPYLIAAFLACRRLFWMHLRELGWRGSWPQTLHADWLSHWNSWRKCVFVSPPILSFWIDSLPIAVLMCAAQDIAMFLVSRFIMGWSSRSILG